MAGKPLNPWQKRGVIAVLLIALYALAGFLLAPWLVERTLVSTLKERLALDAELETLSINPFVLSLTVDELVVKEADGSTLFAFDRLYVNFQLSSLFRWAASFQEIHLIEPVLGAIRYEEARTNFHDLADRWTATGNAAGTAAAPEPEAADETTAAANPPAEATNLPRLLIADLRIVRGSIELTDEVPSETFSTVFAPIDLEVTDLSTLPDRQGNQQVVIRTESGAEVAWTGTLTVNPIALAGELRVAGSYTPLLFRYFRDQLALPVSFDGGDLAANLDYRFAVDRSGALSVIIENLDGTLAGLAVNQPDFPHLVEVEAFKVSGGSLRWPERTVHFDDIHFERVAVDAYRRDSGGYFPPVENEAVPPPTTDEALAEVTEDAAPWTLSADALRLTDWTLSHTDTTIPDSSLRVSEFDLSLEALSNADNATMPLKVLLRPALGGTVELEGSVQLLPTPALTAEVTGAGLLIATVQPYLSTFARVGLAGGTIAFQGSLASEAGTPYRYAGDLELRDLSLIDQVQEEALLSWTRLHVDRIEAEPSKVALSVLSLEAPYARIEIEQDGTTNLARTLVARDADTGAAPQVQSNDAGTSGATGDPVQPMTFSIGQTNIRDASARFTDLALPLPFEANISGLGGSASALSSKSSEPARIDLEGQVNEYGRLTINGALNPFAPRATTDVVVDFDNVDLPRMSPYTIKFAGRRIDEGRTDLTITVGLNEGRLDGNNRLVVRDLTLGEKVDQPGAMDLPLDLAVALLKDPSGELDFSFPVAGTLDDPSFSYGGAVRQAFSNVILGLATAPFRLLGSLVGLESADIEAIGFEPGRADLTPPQREILARLGEALDQRPQLVLELPGVLAPAEDRAALQAIAVDAEVARRLEAEDDGKTLLMEQQRRILESLFRETIQPAEAAEPTGLNLDTLTASHESVDAAGEAQFDEPAYLADLRDLLINAQEIPELELTLLAQRRADAIALELARTAALAESRITRSPVTEVELNEDGLVQLSLNVTTAD